MIIVDPVVLGDVPFTRASPKWVYDRTGTLVQVPANTLGVTYDPADLSKAPWALLETAATNIALQSEAFDDARWGKNGVTVSPNAIAAPNGALTADKLVESVSSSGHYVDQTITINGSAQYTRSIFVKAGERGQVRLEMYSVPTVGARANISFDIASGTFFGEASAAGVVQTYSALRLPNGWWRLFQTFNLGTTDTSCFFRVCLLGPGGASVYQGDGTSGAYVWGAMMGEGSYVATTSAAVTRAADVVGAGAGLVYSNVPMAEPPYNVATTYAKDAAVYDPATKIVYWSMVAGNVGKALSDPAFWNKRTAINRWAMFDDRNSTQTSNPEEIVSVFSAQAITQGLFAGAMDASEVRVSMTHPTRGLVYSETKSLVLPRSGSSFFGWCFNRLRLRTWFLTLKLPVFANALVTVTIKKPGGVPKCGMCLLGPTIDVGLSLMGLSTELKDYSTTTFFTDGSSSTVERGFSKKMSVDIVVERDRVETIEDDLIKRRQKTLVFLGSTMRGDTMLVGRFSSLRKVIDSYPRSKMALQIDGVLSQ